MASKGKAATERRETPGWLRPPPCGSAFTGCCNPAGAKQIRCIRGLWEPGDEYWEMLLKTRWSGWLEERGEQGNLWTKDPC